MKDPPRDADGLVTPHDNEQIQDDDILLRGIPELQIVDTEDGGRRISSGAFSGSSVKSDKYGGLSLAAKKILECSNMTVDDWSAGRFVAIACFPAKMLREAGTQIGWDPLDNDRAHCGAWNASGGSFPKNKTLRKTLAAKANRRFLDE